MNSIIASSHFARDLVSALKALICRTSVRTHFSASMSSSSSPASFGSAFTCTSPLPSPSPSPSPFPSFGGEVFFPAGVADLDLRGLAAFFFFVGDSSSSSTLSSSRLWVGHVLLPGVEVGGFTLLTLAGGRCFLRRLRLRSGRVAILAT